MLKPAWLWPTIGTVALILFFIPRKALRSFFIHPAPATFKFTVPDSAFLFWKVGIIFSILILMLVWKFWPREKHAVKNVISAPPISLISIAMVVAAAIVLRLVILGDSLIYDELFYAENFVVQAWRTVPFMMPVPNNHVLYTWLAKTAVSIGGWNEITLRLPAVLLGILTAPLAMLLARDWFAVRRAWAAGILAAAAPICVELSVSARGYSGLITCAAASMWLFTRALQSGRTRTFIAYIAVTWGMLGFHLYGVFVFATQAIWLTYLFIARGSENEIKPALYRAALSAAAVVALTVALYGGGIPQLYKYASRQGLMMGRHVDAAFFWELLVAFGMGAKPPASAFVFFALVSVGIVAAFNKYRSGVFLAATPFLLALTAAASSRTFVFVRFFSFFSPFYLVFMWLGIEALISRMEFLRLRERAAAITAVIILLLFTLPTLTPYYRLGIQNYKDAALYIERSRPSIYTVSTGLGGNEFQFYNERILPRPRDLGLLRRSMGQLGQIRVIGTYHNTWGNDIKQFIDQFCELEKVYPSSLDSQYDVMIYKCHNQ